MIGKIGPGGPDYAIATIYDIFANNAYYNNKDFRARIQYRINRLINLAPFINKQKLSDLVWSWFNNPLSMEDPKRCYANDKAKAAVISKQSKEFILTDEPKSNKPWVGLKLDGAGNLIRSETCCLLILKDVFAYDN